MMENTLPGNRSLDDVDKAMSELGTMLFSDARLDMAPQAMQAALITSLGFGHVGSMVCLVHARLLWRVLSTSERRAYEERMRIRLQRASSRWQRVLQGKEALVELRSNRPFAGKEGSAEQQRAEMAMLLNSHARMGAKTGRFS